MFDSGRFNVQHKLHVDIDYTWSGAELSDAFDIEEELGEGYTPLHFSSLLALLLSSHHLFALHYSLFIN